MIGMNNEAEEKIQFLQQQLSVLTAIADKQCQQNEQTEILRLKKENQDLKVNLQSLKETLAYWETINGVPQIPVPKISVKTEVPVPESKQCNTVKENLPKVEEKQKQPHKGKQENKVKQENKGNKNKPTKQQDGGEEKPMDSSRLKMRVGKIVNVKKHPDADGLYIEEVDIGEDTPRTIISGLVKHYQLEQMEDKMAIFLVNLKPAKMRGILSQGMIMCASTPEKVEILEVPEGASIGDAVTCEGYAGEPDTQLNPKKKIWEQIQPDLHVNSERVATYKGGAFTIEGKGQCKAPTMHGCPIKQPKKKLQQPASIDCAAEDEAMK